MPQLGPLLAFGLLLLGQGFGLQWTIASGLEAINKMPSVGQASDASKVAPSGRRAGPPVGKKAHGAGPPPRKGVHKPTGNAKFVTLFTQFRRALYPAGSALDAQLEEAIEERSPPLSSVEQRVKWVPVQCSVMGIVLGRRQSIADEGPKKNAVYKVWDRNDPRRVYAYKLFGKPNDYTSELAVFMLADHRRIVKPICIQHEMRADKSARPGILMEYVAGRSSLDVAKDPATKPATLKRMAAQLLETLKYLHRLGFVHADLKPDNVLVRQNGDIVLIDFGYAVHLPHQHPSRGNPHIKAPELSGLLHGALNEAIDMWAWSATVGIWYGYVYLPPHRRSGKKYAILYNGRSSSPWKIGAVPTRFPEDLRAILYLGTSLDVERRRFQHEATYRLLQSMPFFASIDWDTI